MPPKREIINKLNSLKVLIIVESESFNLEIATIMNEYMIKYNIFNYFIFTGTNAQELKYKLLDKTQINNYIIYEEKKNYNEIIRDITPLLANHIKSDDIIYLTTSNVYLPLSKIFEEIRDKNLNDSYYYIDVYYDELPNTWITENPQGRYTIKCMLVRDDQYNKGKRAVTQTCITSYFRLQELFLLKDIDHVVDINMLPYYYENKLKLKPIKSTFTGLTSLDKFKNRDEEKIKEKLRERNELIKKKTSAGPLVPRLEEAFIRTDLKGISIMFPTDFPNNQPERSLGSEAKWKSLIELLNRNKGTLVYLLGGFPWRNLNYRKLDTVYSVEEYRAVMNDVEPLYIEVLQHSKLVFGYQYGNTYFINLANKLGIPVYFYGHNVEKITEATTNKCVGINRPGLEFEYIDTYNELRHILEV